MNTYLDILDIDLTYVTGVEYCYMLLPTYWDATPSTLPVNSVN